MLAIRLPQPIEARLEALAKATGRTKSFYAREAIVDHIEDLEDIYLAEQRLTEIRSGGETVSHAHLMKKYGR
jgi:RHH-type transcriptional regulator, rel operon repressor / antitoxin RelB